MKYEGEKNKFCFGGIFAFLIPVVVFGLAFFLSGIYPGGKYTVLTYDLKSQVLPMYGYLSEKGPGFDGFLYSMSGGLGGNFFGSFVLYYSFFDFIYCFIPVEFIPEAIYCLTLLKIGLCGFFCYFFLRQKITVEKCEVFTVLLSCAYALMSYNFIYSMTPIWLDSVMLLPLLAHFLDKMMLKGKSAAFVFLLAICIIDYYYFAYMNMICLFLYFMFRQIEDTTDIRSFFRDFLKFFIHCFLSVGVSSVVLFPVIYDFARGKLSSGSSVTNGQFIENSVLDIIRMFLPQNFSDPATGSSPNIFCSSLVVVLLIFLFFIKKISKRTKIASFIILFIYFISFALLPFNRIWHGFRDPLGFPYRYSYTFVFFLIYISSKVINNLNLFAIPKKIIKYSYALIFVYTLFEMFLNGSYIISKIQTDFNYVLKSEYQRNVSVLKNDLILPIDEHNYSRMEKTYSFTSWDGALMGYDGLEMFSSSYNDDLIRFLYSLGLDAYSNHISSEGLTPPVADFLNIGYLLSFYIADSDYYDNFLDHNSYHLLKNETVYTLAMYLAEGMSSDWLNSRNPYININNLITSVSGLESDVFVEQLYDLVKTDESDESVIIRFTPDKEGRYWFYRAVPNDGEYDTQNPELDYHRILSYYLDDEYLGDYGQFGFRYCSDLGYLNSDQEYILKLDSPYTKSGEVFLVYLDLDKREEASSSVVCIGISDIGSNGIVLKGYTESDSDLIVTLPYEKGYKITVNGQKKEYYSFKSVFLRIPLKKGENTVYIKFVPEGIYAGLFVSIAFMIMIFGYFFFQKKHDRTKKEKN